MDHLKVTKGSARTSGLSHHLPHRTRYRLPKQSRTGEVASKIRASVSKVAGVTDVEVNERTGSVLINHEKRNGILPELHDAMDSIGDVFEELLEEEGETIMPGFSVLAHVVKKRAKNADVYVSGKTNNYLNLKSLVPLLFLGAGLLRATKSKEMVGHVPALVLFYYAFDTYLKFHPPEVSAIKAIETAGNGTTKKLTVSAQ